MIPSEGITKSVPRPFCRILIVVDLVSSVGGWRRFLIFAEKTAEGFWTCRCWKSLVNAGIIKRGHGTHVMLRTGMRYSTADHGWFRTQRSTRFRALNFPDDSLHCRVPGTVVVIVRNSGWYEALKERRARC